MIKVAFPPVDAQPADPGAKDAVDASRTPLGSRLRALREQILETGEPLLDWDDIYAEVAARRGGFPGER